MSKPTRREFLKYTVLGAVGTGMAMTVLRPEELLAEPQAKGSRGYAAGKYALELDGVMAGWISSVEGGHATSDVVSGKIGPGAIQKKPIGNVKYEDITLTCGTGMSKGFYEWIKAAFDYQNARKNGAIVACDYNFNELTRLEFNNALITEMGFPALDAASKDAAKMTIKISPEVTREKTSAGGAGKMFPAKAQKAWLPSNFRLQIPTLDCTKVDKIEAITLKRKVTANSVGQMRDYEKEPANLQTPILIIHLPEAHAKDFYDWHEKFVIAGNSNSSQEKSGQLEYLTPDLRETLFALNFQHVGIFKVTPDKAQAGSESIRRVKAEMYCEQIRFGYGPGATWA